MQQQHCFNRDQLVKAMAYWEGKHATQDLRLCKEVSLIVDVVATMDFFKEKEVDLVSDARRLAIVIEGIKEQVGEVQVEKIN
jgi:hypothetical protein